MPFCTRDKRLGPPAGLRGIWSTVSVRLPSSSKRRGEYRRLPLSVTLALSVSPQTKNPNEALVAATPTAVAAMNPTVGQQAKETAQGGLDELELHRCWQQKGALPPTTLP